MARGFTLLELLITVSVLSILLTIAAPNFKQVSDTQKMRRLAGEINGLMMSARSEAVMRKQPLWVHIVMSGSVNSQGEWQIVLTNSGTYPGGQVISSLSGQPYRNIELGVNYPSNQIHFEAINGRAVNGSLDFSTHQGALKFTTYRPSGRMRLCGNGGDYFGFKQCS